MYNQGTNKNRKFNINEGCKVKRMKMRMKEVS